MFRVLRAATAAGCFDHATSMTWLAMDAGIYSLRGHVWIARDSDGDHLEDELTLFEEGLAAAPFGILTDGNSILVAHKPEVLRLTDTDVTERQMNRSGRFRLGIQ